MWRSNSESNVVLSPEPQLDPFQMLWPRPRSDSRGPNDNFVASKEFGEESEPRRVEPRRVCRRLISLSHAAIV